jgi:fibronectin type 3 domain-containing protein
MSSTKLLVSFGGLLLALLAGAATAQVNPARTATGLIALYPFSEGTGTTVADQSGYGSPMNLKLYGAVSWNNSGNGVVLSGGRVGTGGQASKVINALRNSNSSSFEIWFKPANTSQGGPSRLIALAKDPYQRNFLLGQEGKNVHARLRHNGKSGDKPHLITSNAPLSTRRTHLVHTYDGNVERLYINGVLQSAKVTRTGAYSGWYTNHLLSIGNESTNNRPFAGTVELVAIYNRALVGSEVKQNYDAGTTTSSVPDTTPPSTPGSLSARSLSTTSVELSWIEALDDNAVAGYEVYRDGVRIGKPSGTRYVDASPSPNTRYRYSVKAYDAAGNKSPSAAITFTTPLNVASRTRSGLLALYTFDTGSGSTVKDKSGYGSPMNLQLSGAVTWSKTESGVIMSGGKVATTGAASKVINALRSSNASSFEAWVKPSNVSQRGPTRFISIAASPTQRNYLLGQETDEVHVRLRHTGKSVDKPHLITKNSPLRTQWVHVVHTYDGNTERLYLNGNLQSAQVSSRGSYSNWYTTHKLTVGNEISGDRPFAGQVKLVAIYNRAIDNAEIQQNYAAGPSGAGGDTSTGGTVDGSTGGSGTATDSGTITDPAPDADSGTTSGTGTTGSVQISWKIPDTRSTGETLPLSDLNRYEIYASPTAGGKTNVFIVTNPEATSYTLSGLAKGKYYLNMIAVDKAGLSSKPSPTVTISVI